MGTTLKANSQVSNSKVYISGVCGAAAYNSKVTLRCGLPYVPIYIYIYIYIYSNMCVGWWSCEYIPLFLYGLSACSSYPSTRKMPKCQDAQQTNCVE